MPSFIRRKFLTAVTAFFGGFALLISSIFTYPAVLSVSVCSAGVNISFIVLIFCSQYHPPLFLKGGRSALADRGVVFSRPIYYIYVTQPLKTMKTLFTLLFCLFTFAFLFSCGNDSVTNNTNTPPLTPTFQDSIPKLLSPANGTLFNLGDSVHLTWSRAYHTSYYLYIDTLPDFSTQWYETVNDTTALFISNEHTGISFYWKIQPINHFEMTSDTAYFSY